MIFLMAKVYLETYVDAPVERVFDLARSIDLHTLSMKDTNERPAGGRTVGLMGLHETVTWRARHFGVFQELTVVITRLERPYLFADKMTKGAFASMHHLHRFEEAGQGTKMTDVFEFTSPYGFVGRLAERAFLKGYMERLLKRRNMALKAVAEGDAWVALLARG